MIQRESDSWNAKNVWMRVKLGLILKVYGEPDYKYYRHNYCGPCGCAPPGYRGDPNGQNPNIRYVQLDYNNLLGSGFATQTASASQFMKGSQYKLNSNDDFINTRLSWEYQRVIWFCVSGTPPLEQTRCGKEHCQTCSGVYKAAKQPVKFQVCIGDPQCPSTMPPCPQQPLQVYVPSQMVPKQGQPTECSGDNGDGEGAGMKKLQDFEVHIPGMTDQKPSTDVTGPDTSPDSSGDAPGQVQKKSHYLDPCGNCTTCKLVQGSTQSKCRPMPPQRISCMNTSPPREWIINGQKYTSGFLLQTAKKPFRSSPLKK